MFCKCLYFTFDRESFACKTDISKQVYRAAICGWLQTLSSKTFCYMWTSAYFNYSNYNFLDLNTIICITYHYDIDPMAAFSLFHWSIYFRVIPVLSPTSIGLLTANYSNQTQAIMKCSSGIRRPVNKMSTAKIWEIQSGRRILVC